VKVLNSFTTNFIPAYWQPSQRLAGLPRGGRVEKNAFSVNQQVGLLVDTQPLLHHKGWSLPYAQYLELRPGSQYGYRVTEVFALWSQGHEG